MGHPRAALSRAPPPPRPSPTRGEGEHAPLVPARRIGRGYWADVGRRLLKDKVAVIAAIVILVIVLAAIFAPFVAPADPYRGSMLRRLRPVGGGLYRLRSHQPRRDQLTRPLHGGAAV